MPSKNVGAMPFAFGNGENEAEARLPLTRTLGIDMVAALVACDSAAVPLSFVMILNSSSAVPPKKTTREQSFLFLTLHTLARMPPPPYSKTRPKSESLVTFM